MAQQSPNTVRIDIQGGMSTAQSSDLLEPGKYSYLQNVRRLLQGRTVSRPQMSDNTLASALPSGPTSMIRMNDTTTEGPTSGYVMVIGAAGKMYVNVTQVESGLSGLPLGFAIFRPNSSPRPWCYTGDANGMFKVASDGTVYKVGVKEPQAAPTIGVSGNTLTGTFTLDANAAPWTNYGDVNANVNYGETSYGGGGSDGGPAYIGNLVKDATLVITVTGSATVNSATHAPGDSVSGTSSYPGYHNTAGHATQVVVLGAFTDSSGNVVTTTTAGSTYAVYNIGASATLTVPPNAVQLQIGIDSSANTFYENSGSFSVSYTLSISAASSTLGLAGDVTAYYWGDSPHSGAVGSYLWRNPSDTGGSSQYDRVVGTGPTGTYSTASYGSQSGSSLIFDSTVETSSNPVVWTTLDSDGTISGYTDLFSSEIQPSQYSGDGYADFNCCIIGSFFVPEAGTYTFTILNKDQVMFGIGGSATCSLSTPTGRMGQTETVVSGLTLMYVSATNTEGSAVSETFTVTFPSEGSYEFEIDWDYWDHSGRTLVVTASATPGASVSVIPPLDESTYHIDSQYRYVYRSSATGALSNPSPASSSQTIPLQANTITSVYSTDPQVDKVDYYRIDSSLDSYTYVATGPNDNGGSDGYNTPIMDTLLDTAIESNTTLSYDNFEPFPSLDLPAKGVVDVGNGGIISWVSGTKFNIRWLPGTVISVGSPSSISYTMLSRPTSTTAMTLDGVLSGENLAYEITEPYLAAEPSPILFGPTPENAGAFAFGIDPNNPGDLVWTKGNNFDSSPDTNRLNVTSPSEVLMNGVITSEISAIFSTERFWLIYPNFSDAVATITGITGQQWTLTQSSAQRGLYCRYAIDALGSMIAYRAKDCIAVSMGGGAEQSISDDIYNLFPHGGSAPSSVTIAGNTVYPPDDSLPNTQTIRIVPGYIFYNYQDATSTPRTLVYDIAGKGWSVDVYSPTVNCHLWATGQVNLVQCGCTDGTVRSLSGGAGTETGTSVIVTRSENGGSERIIKRLGGWFLRAVASSAITLSYYAQRLQTSITGFTPSSVTGTSGVEQDFLVDFTAATNADVRDAAMKMSWALGSTNILSSYEVDWTMMPEQIIGFKTGMLSYGNKGWMSATWINLAYQSTEAVTVVMTLDNGSAITLTFPSTSGSQVKQFMTLPANKFKLVEWTINSSSPFSISAADCEMLLCQWGGNSGVMKPFEGFGIVGSTN